MLEALDAKQGDALLLHFGTAAAPKLAVIDGGPSGVFKRLRARLEALQAARAPGAALPVSLLMVSHIDDDHIRGILDLTDHLIQQDADGETPLVEIARLWHNSFGDVVGGGTEADVAGVVPAAAAIAGGAASALLPTRHIESALLLANVPQGQRLRANARKLRIAVNPGYGGPVTSGGKAQSIDGLSLRPICPLAERVADLKKEWAKAIKRAAAASVAELRATIAAYADTSVFNLSSLVVLASKGKKRMLLTGDARGDDILEGLNKAKLLPGGTLHVDLLKVPHHGSDRNVEEEFFRSVTADHYVISADGKYGNPDPDTIRMLSAARGTAKYTVHLTNKVAAVEKVLAQKSKQSGFTVHYRDPKEPSLCVDLG